MDDIKLPSGALLKVNLAPFGEARALHKAFLDASKTIQVVTGAQVVNVYKDVDCLMFSNEKIDGAAWKCMSRCLYDGLKIDETTFESEKARDDFTTVYREVTRANLRPLMRNLSAGCLLFLTALENAPE